MLRSWGLHGACWGRGVRAHHVGEQRPVQPLHVQQHADVRRHEAHVVAHPRGRRDLVHDVQPAPYERGRKARCARAALVGGVLRNRLLHHFQRDAFLAPYFEVLVDVGIEVLELGAMRLFLLVGQIVDELRAFELL